MTEQEQMIDDIEDRESRVNDWEREFISSIKSRLDDDMNLTTRQEEILERIWNKVTQRGLK